MELLEKITALMEKETLLSVEYISEGVTIKVTKAGFKAPEVAELDKEDKGSEEEDEEVLFWSSDNK